MLGLATARDSFFLKGANGDVPEGWCIAEDGFPPSTFAGRIEVLGVKVHASVGLCRTIRQITCVVGADFGCWYG